jgi:hypothetical protein
VHLENRLNNRISEYITVNFKHVTPNGKRLAWLNNRGGFDYYTFTWSQEHEKNVDRNVILTEGIEPIGESRRF